MNYLPKDLIYLIYDHLGFMELDKLALSNDVWKHVLKSQFGETSEDPRVRFAELDLKRQREKVKFLEDLNNFPEYLELKKLIKKIKSDREDQVEKAKSKIKDLKEIVNDNLEESVFCTYSSVYAPVCHYKSIKGTPFCKKHINTKSGIRYLKNKAK